MKSQPSKLSPEYVRALLEAIDTSDWYPGRPKPHSKKVIRRTEAQVRTARAAGWTGRIRWSV